MSDWCPENDGAYRMELAERARASAARYTQADMDAAVNEALERAAEAVFSVRCAPVSREVAEWAEERAEVILAMKKETGK